MSKKNNLGRRKRQYEFELRSNILYSIFHLPIYSIYHCMYWFLCIYISLSCGLIFVLKIRRKRTAWEVTSKEEQDESKYLWICVCIFILWFLCIVLFCWVLMEKGLFRNIFQNLFNFGSVMLLIVHYSPGNIRH